LLFLRYLADSVSSCASPRVPLHDPNADCEVAAHAKYSCVTFGAPPITNIDLTLVTQNQGLYQNRGFVHAIINEYDLVTRADQAYIRCIVDLYRASYGLSPVTDDLVSQPSDSEVPPLAGKDVWVAQILDQPNARPLPRPLLWSFGYRVVLKVEPVRQGSIVHGGLLVGKRLKALKVTPEVLSTLIFTKVSVHSRVVYEERMEEIAKGHFNGRES